MANYWLKRSSSSSAQGPFTGSQLKAMAAAGELGADALISPDNSKWVVASKVKGLFSQPAPAAPQPQESELPPSEESYDLAPAPLHDDVPGPQSPPMALTYATAAAGRPRKVQWYSICAIVLIVMGVAMQVLPYTGVLQSAVAPPRTVRTTRVTPSGRRVVTTVPGRRGPNFAFIFGYLAAMMVLLGGVLGLHIYFTIWAYLVHREFQQFTHGAYPISPGKACGFCYIPFYNLYWICYMPFKLSEAVDWHLGSARRQTNPSTVMIFQIVGLVTGFCITGLQSLFFGLSMRNIQAGLNELWARSTSPSEPQS
jgi:hypothetical protein